MSEIFLNIINMSISAGWIVIAVLVLRLCLKKAPKWLTVLLWGIVAVRLVCPFSIESVLSLIPSAETVSPGIMTDKIPQINSGIPIINDAVNPIIGGSLAPEPGASANPLQIWVPILAVVWVIGIVCLLVYTAVSYYRLKRRVKTAVLLRDNISQSESVISPFVLGIIKPRIYIPFGMDEQNLEHVIAHENAHIKRHDHLWKPLGFLLLTLHWFNPLLWVGYVLLCRDIEFACDEKVVKEYSTEQKADYSEALLTCSVNRRMIKACPLAFGEVGVKDRVKSVLNYKKPAFWIIVVSVIALVIASVCLLTDPKTNKGIEIDDDLRSFMDICVKDHNKSDKTKENFAVTSIDVLRADESRTEVTVYALVIYKEYSCAGGVLKSESGSYIPTVITAEKTDGEYTLTEYWIPRDGNYYPNDIKRKFPKKLWDRVFDDHYDHAERTAECERLAKEYFGISDDVIKPTPTPTEPPIDTASILTRDISEEIRELRERYPMYFDRETMKGLDVYIWKMSESSYWSILLPGTNSIPLYEKIFELQAKYPVTLENMAVIIASYYLDDPDLSVSIVPTTCRLSSYAYKIDNDLKTEMSNKLWSYFPIKKIYYSDKTEFDVDNDGKEETCYVGIGPTSGIPTLGVIITENGILEYSDVFEAPIYNLGFKVSNKKLYVECGKSNTDVLTEVIYSYEVSIDNGRIVLTNQLDSNDVLKYWG